MPELQNLLERAARQPSQPLDLEILRQRARRRRHARLARRGVASAAVLVVVVASTVWLTQRIHRPAITNQPPQPGTWTTLNAGPLSGRSDAVVAWTGTKMIIWGGTSYGIRRVHGVFSFGPDGPLNPEGATFDPKRNRWSPIAPSPMGPRSAAASAWTGTELLEWGGGRTETNLPLTPGATDLAADGAIYNPSTNRWRTMSASPLPAVRPAAYAWTGTELIIWGSRTSSIPPVGAAYNPRTNSWRFLPAAPLDFQQAAGAWTGTDVLIVGASTDAINRPVPHQPGAPPSPPAGTQAMAYNPATNTWRLLPAPALVPQSTFAASTGRTVIAWDYLLHAQRLEVNGTNWQPLPNVPLHPLECYTTGLPTGDTILAIYCTHAARFDPNRSTWQPITPPKPFQITEAAWTGHQILFWGLNISTNPAHTRTLEYQPH